MIEPTPEQQEAVACPEQVPLFGAEDDAQFQREMYPHVMKIFGAAGWDDPAMDEYDDLDPRKSR